MHPLPVSVPVATQSNLSLSLRWSAISSLQEGRQYRQSEGILTSFWRPFSIARRTPSAAISDFRFCNWRWCDALSLHCVCAVFRRGTGVPLCSTGLPRVCLRQAVRDKHVIGTHAGACSSFWRCADVYRVAGVARLQEIRTGCASRSAALLGSNKPLIAPVSTTTARSNFA